MDGIGLDVSIEYPDWTGLDWIHKSMDWFGLRLEKWTHVQVCVGISEQKSGITRTTQSECLNGINRKSVNMITEECKKLPERTLISTTNKDYIPL